MLLVVAVVGAAFLLAMRRVVGAIQIQQQVGRWSTSGALAFAQIDAQQRRR
jgi:hypothetical protein